MSQYPQYPTEPHDPNAPQGGSNPYGGSPAPGYGAPANPAVRPRSADLAVKLIWGSIALSLVSGIVTFTMMDAIVDQQLEAAGVSEAVNADAVRSAATIGAIIGLVISVAIYALLAIFISKGRNWARIVYTVFTVIGVLTSLVGIATQPPLLLVLSVVGLLLSVAAVVFLFRSDSNAWFKARKARAA